MGSKAAWYRIPTRLRQYAEQSEWIPKGPKSLILHPAGPLTIHFWAPAWKWGLVVAGIADLSRPAENISRPNSIALSLTGVVWSRYATQITPVNYNLLSVNVFVAATGIYQLYRSYQWENSQKQPGLLKTANAK